MSRSRNPAFSAGEPGCTAAMATPSSEDTPSLLGDLRVEVGHLDAESCRGALRRTWRSGSCTARAMFDGTAKPMPTLPPAGPMIAVLMPISSPRRFTSAPPELPGLMEASVWMKSS